MYGSTDYVVVTPPMPGPTSPAPAPSSPSRGFAWKVTGGAVATLGIASAVFVPQIGPTVVSGTPTAGPEPTVDLVVNFALYDDSGYRYNRSDCSGGVGGYSDIDPGMPFTFRDEAGDVVASSFLPSYGEEVSGGGCIWTMTVEIPKYTQQVVITGGSRGDITYSRDRLVADGWQVDMGIGDE